MAITQEQREKMSRYVGASRIAAVLGRDPWSTAEEVRLKMLGAVEGGDIGIRGWIGNHMEPAIVSMISERAGVKFATDPDVLEYVAANDRMIAHPDGATPTLTALAEAKYSHLVQDWGEGRDADSLPLRVLLQVVGQLICVPQAERVYVGALLIDRESPEFRLYTVERPVELCQEVEASVLAWHERHIVRGEICEDAPQALDTLKAINRDPDVVVSVDPRWFDEALQANEARKAAEKAEEAAMGQLFAAMDHASREMGLTVPAASATDGKRKFWYKTENAGMRVNTDLLKSQHPDVYAAVAAAATRKMLRWYGLPKK